ncbi:MAG: hypothetical protein PHT69_00035 [Bacteroidales bacterium]|nr:hypothetical protein [Bacteroidales bacterium]
MRFINKQNLKFWARLILFILVFSNFFLSGCRKPGKGKPGDDGGDIQPMYGIKTSIFKKL